MTEEEKREDSAPGPAPDGAERGDAAPQPESTESESGKPESTESESTKPPAAPPAKVNYTFLAITSAVMLAADLGSKEWAAKRLEGPRIEPIKVIEGIEVLGYTVGLHFDLAKNKGGAWGFFGELPDYVRLPFFFIISALAVIFIVGLWRKLEPRQWALKWALPLVLAGAIGNLVDRIRHQYVVDFIDAFMISENKVSHWPTFNVADIWIVAGVILMGIDWFTPNRTPKGSRERRAVRIRG